MEGARYTRFEGKCAAPARYGGQMSILQTARRSSQTPLRDAVEYRGCRIHFAARGEGPPVLFIQGVAQVFRCVLCMRDGDWMRAVDDVEETEKILMEAKSLEVLNEDLADGESGDSQTERRP